MLVSRCTLGASFPDIVRIPSSAFRIEDVTLIAEILMIISAADALTLADGSAHPTGYWAEEVAASHKVLTEAGHTVRIATPGGARPTVDAISLDERGGVDAAVFRRAWSPSRRTWRPRSTSPPSAPPTTPPCTCPAGTPR